MSSYENELCEVYLDWNQNLNANILYENIIFGVSGLNSLCFSELGKARSLNSLWFTLRVVFIKGKCLRIFLPSLTKSLTVLKHWKTIEGNNFTITAIVLPQYVRMNNEHWIYSNIKRFMIFMCVRSYVLITKPLHLSSS